MIDVDLFVGSDNLRIDIHNNRLQHNKSYILFNIISINNKTIGNICLWVVLFTSFYYPIGVGLVLFLRLPSTSVNIILRTIPALAALYLFVVYILSAKKSIQFTREIWFLLLFWLFYSVRILYDLGRGIRFADYGNETIYGITFGNILMPILATILWAKHIEIERVVQVLYALFVVNNVVIFTILMSQNNLGIGIFATRPEIWGNTPTKSDLSILNPITISLYGEMLTIATIYFLTIAKTGKKIVLIPLLALGIVVLVLGSSRGPFFNCIICIVLLFVYKYSYFQPKLLSLLKFFFGIVISLVIIVKIFEQFISVEDFNLITRLVRFSEERQYGVVEYRDIQFASAWQDFLDSPIIGKQFVGTLDNFYPHNIVLEILMATGIVGAIIFGLFFVPFLKRVKQILIQKNPNYIFLVFIFIPILLGSLFSGSLYQSVDLWLIMVLILAMPLQNIDANSSFGQQNI